MFVWSFRMNKRELIIAGAGMVIFILLAAALLARGGAFERKERADARAATAEQREAYLTGLGWEIERTPLSVREVKIPAGFDAEYAVYSGLQSEQGFDLQALRGERVKLYTYRVNNYPAENADMVANLLVKDGRVVGGDICQARAGGMTQGLDPAAYGSAASRLQREMAASAIDRSVPDAIPADSDAIPEPDSEGEW